LFYRYIRSCALLILLLCGATPLHAQQSRPQLFVYLQQGGVQLNQPAIQALLPGDSVDFLTPDGRVYAVIFDSQQRNKSGTLHWIGHFSAAGPDYRVIITWDSGGFGNIHTPDGDFLLETRDGEARLIDLLKSPRQILPMGDDMRIPLSPSFPLPESAATHAISLADVPAGIAQIDVMVLYTSGLVALWGADLVTLLRPYNQTVDPAACGLAILSGSNGQACRPDDEFSVVNDGGNCSDY